MAYRNGKPRTWLAEARLRKVAEGGSVFAQGAPALRFYMLVEGG